MAAIPNPVFKFHREMHTVKVENIAESGRRSMYYWRWCICTHNWPHVASVQDIVDLFTTLIGKAPRVYVSKLDHMLMTCVLR